jgi:hypothetical protein
MRFDFAHYLMRMFEVALGGAKASVGCKMERSNTSALRNTSVRFHGLRLRNCGVLHDGPPACGVGTRRRRYGMFDRPQLIVCFHSLLRQHLTMIRQRLCDIVVHEMTDISGVAEQMLS